jgi:hypothetical protein
MVRSSIASALAVATLGLGSFAVQAQEVTMADYFRMSAIDANKDGMVSRQEYLDMAAKSYDMMAKKMNSKSAGMSADEFKRFMAEYGKITPN